MTSRLRLLGRGFAPYFSCLLFCSVALVLSLPFSLRPADSVLGLSPTRPSVFFLTYVMMVALFGVARGAAAADVARRRTAVGWIAGEILIVQLTLLPLIVFARVLVSQEPQILFLAFLYATCTALMWGLTTYRLERWARVHRIPSFALRYGGFLIVALLPLIFALGASQVSALLVLSPIGTMTALLNQSQAGITALAFLFPALVSLACLSVRTKRSVRNTS